MKQAVVTGATGFVGSRLVEELAQNGYKVRALHRESSDVTALQELVTKGLACELVAGDVTDSASLERAFEGADVIFHIAALFRQAKFPNSIYHEVNVEGTRNVFETAIKCGVPRVVHCSTVGVHSHIPNPPADETEAYRPGDIYQETKCEGEKLALSYYESGKVQGAVIRPAMIWGPRDERTLKLFKGVAGGRLPLIGTGRTLVHWVLVDDLVRAFRLAGEKDGCSGEIYIIAGERPVTMRYLFETIAKCFRTRGFRTRAPAITIPAGPVRFMAGLVEAVCVPLGIEPPIFRRRVDFFTKSRAFNIEKAERELGYKPTRTFEEEVQLISNWYVEAGWIPGQNVAQAVASIITAAIGAFSV